VCDKRKEVIAAINFVKQYVEKLNKNYVVPIEKLDLIKEYIKQDDNSSLEAQNPSSKGVF